MRKRVEPKRVRKAEIIRYLVGREAMTIVQIARAMKLDKRTTARYLAEMRRENLVLLENSKTRPYKYFIPIKGSYETD